MQSLRTIDKGDSCVPAFLAVIALLDGKLPEAEVLAREALAVEPKGPAALVAMSYVQQASFQLDDALVSVSTALQSHPHDGLLLSRLAELTQSIDNTSPKAIETAELAVRQAPNLAYPHTILGFAHAQQDGSGSCRTSLPTGHSAGSGRTFAEAGLGVGGNL